jgi:ankyrin repeat protein
MFSITISIDIQMRILNDLRNSNNDIDKEKAKDIFIKGEQLVSHASNGELRKLKLLSDELMNKYNNDLFIPTYFIAKMFKSSLENGHLMIASYIIDQGYPYQSFNVPNSLQECLRLVEDHRGVDIVEFLISKGLDVNYQSQGTWLTALHIAAEVGLIETVKTLIRLGADLNAVADGDLMPLHMTDKCNASTKDEIVELLKSNGAKLSWRKDNIQTANTVFKSFSGSHQSSLASFNPTKSSLSDYVFDGDIKPMSNPTTTTTTTSNQKVRFSGMHVVDSSEIVKNEKEVGSIEVPDISEMSLNDNAYSSHSSDGAMIFSTSS